MLAVTWTGNGGDNLWSNPLNWSGDLLPGASDDVTINAAPGITIIHDSTSDDSIASLTSTSPISLTGGTLDIAGGLFITAHMSIEGGTLKDAIVAPSSAPNLAFDNFDPGFRAGELDGVTLEGNVSWSGFFGITVANGLTLNGGATVALSDGVSLNFEGTQSLAGSGTVNLIHGSDGSAGLFVLGGGTQQTAATLTITQHITIKSGGSNDGNEDGFVDAYRSYDLIDNQGVIEADASLLATFGTLVNNGTLEAVNGGTIELEGSATNNGALKADSGTIEVFDTLTNNADVALDSSSQLFFGDTAVLTGGTLVIDGLNPISGSGTLDNVTLVGNLSVSGTVLIISNGLTLTGGSTVALDDGAELYFEGTQTLGGSGTVAFGGTSESVMYAVGGGSQATAATLTIGSGVTIHSAGADGLVMGFDYLNSNRDGFDMIDNDGSIEADAAFITINGTNNGTLEAINGGTLIIAGTFNNNTSVLIDQTSTLSLYGELKGGTLASQSTMPIAGPDSLSTGGLPTLDGVTLSGNLVVSGNLFMQLNITGGLTLSNGATVSLDDGAELFFQGTQTVGGTGTVSFDGTTESYLFGGGQSINGTGAATLTIGSGVTIQSAGADGYVSGYSPEDMINNEGKIEADAGKTITLIEDAGGSGTGPWTNDGTVEAINGGTIHIGIGGTLTNNSTVSIESGSTLDSAGTLAGGTLAIQGTVSDGATLDDVTLDGDLTLTGVTLDIHNGLTLSNGAMVSLNASVLFFLGTQTLGGTGTIVFGGTTESVVYAFGGDPPEAAATLTIGPGIAIHSAGADGAVEGFDSTNGDHQGFDMIDNEGSIKADGANIIINGTNNGTLEAINGGSLVIGSVLNNNTSVLIDQTSTLSLYGELKGGTLVIHSTMPLDGANAPLAGPVTFPTLDGVTLSGNLLVSGSVFTQLNVISGLTLINGATMSLSDGAGLFFEGTQSLEGTGTVSFGGTLSALYAVDGQSHAVLTIGSGIIILAEADAYIKGVDFTPDGTYQESTEPFDSIINNGTIVADTAGKTLTIHGLVNAGTITLGPQSTFIAHGDFAQASTGVLNVELGGPTPDLYGHGVINGAAILAGTLNVTESNGFKPLAGNVFTILTSNLVASQFTDYAGLARPGNVAYDLQDVLLGVSAAPPISPELQLFRIALGPVIASQSNNAFTVPPVFAQQLLLLVLLPEVPLVTASIPQGDGGIPPRAQQTEVPIGSASVTDLVFGGDDVNTNPVLASFLDFVDPEALVIDLGDEPPAMIAAEVPKPTATHGAAAHNDSLASGNTTKQTDTGTQANSPNGSVTVMKPAVDAIAETPIAVRTDSALRGMLANNWKWIASLCGVLMLAGAGWKGRPVWIQFVRSLRSR